MGCQRTIITQELLQAFCPASVKFLDGLQACERESEINTPRQVEHFLATLAQESMGFRYVRELGGQTKAQRRYEPGVSVDGKPSLAPGLGNTQAGDGFKYLGRTLGQLTGRKNYTAASLAFGENFIDDPKKLELPYWAAR